MIVFMEKNLLCRSKYLIIVLTFMLAWPTQSTKIIFDLGNVLINTDSIAVFKTLGIKNVICYMFLMRYLTPKTMKTKLHCKLYEILNKEEIAKKLRIKSCNKYYDVKDPNGSILPTIMCAWLEGTIPCEKIKIITSQTIDMHPEWFTCRAEQCIVQSLTQLIFTPEKFSRVMKFNANAIKFVKECKAKGHQVYILSNWDKESFSLLQKKYSDTFALFDGIIVSGEHRCTKPNKEIYTKLLEQYKLKPRECVFIDDQLENLATARKLGIFAIHCKQNKKLFRSKQNIVKIHQYLIKKKE